MSGFPGFSLGEIGTSLLELCVSVRYARGFFSIYDVQIKGLYSRDRVSSSFKNQEPVVELGVMAHASIPTLEAEAS